MLANGSDTRFASFVHKNDQFVKMTIIPLDALFYFKRQNEVFFLCHRQQINSHVDIKHTTHFFFQNGCCLLEACDFTATLL